MSRTLPLHASLSGYQLRLATFEGPLDVLLSLIERERLEISSLSLVQVTDGFLQYIAELQDPPPALLAEFAGIAARLLVLKSRSLLPRPEAQEAEPEVDDLAAQLREYQRVKHAALALRERHMSGAQSFPRARSAIDEPTRVVLVPSPVGHLRRALLRVLSRARPPAEVATMTPLIPISEMIGRFRAFLTRRRRSSFADMVDGRHRSERIAGFIALLALWRRGEVHVAQQQLFGDILVEATGMPVVADAAADD